jgi:hypothetical protein
LPSADYQGFFVPVAVFSEAASGERFVGFFGVTDDHQCQCTHGVPPFFPLIKVEPICFYVPTITWRTPHRFGAS